MLSERMPLEKITIYLPPFQDEEFETMIKAGEKIEQLYSHWFDLTIENEELPTAFENLLKSVRRLDQDAQWVPASWVQ